MNLLVQKSISIKAAPSKVWSLLTNVELSKTYLSSIIISPLYDSEKGKIMHIIPEKLLHTIPSSILAKPIIDSADQYNVIYELEVDQTATVIRITHRNIPNKERAKEIDNAWGKFLPLVKQMSEEG